MANDRIEKQVLLHASRPRIWQALADSTEFGLWFGMKFDAPFTPGASLRGIIVPTAVNAEVAASQKPYEGTPVQMIIQQMEPDRIFSYRWHPGAVDPALDYSVEPTTLVVFALEDATGGVLLTITESGFDQLPISRRDKALTQNEAGWSMVVKLIGEYLVQVQAR